MDDDLALFLRHLSIEHHADVFRDEEIHSTKLLASMGPDMLRNNLKELNIPQNDVEKIATRLFGPKEITHEDQQSIQTHNQMQETHKQLQPTENAARHQQETGTEEELAENEALEEQLDWLIKPQLITNPLELKAKVIHLTALGNNYLARGMYANARATYTQALQLEAPNKESSAALYFNRSAANKHLHNMYEALRDATLAAEAHPPQSAKAWWRVADIALHLGDSETTEEAIEAGLRWRPNCVELKQLQAQHRAMVAGI